MLTIKGMPYLLQEQSEEIIAFPSKWFDIMFEEEWLEQDIVRDFITDINGTDVSNKDKSVLELLIINNTPPRLLCTGVKNLINCMQFSEYMHRLAFMGENCFKYLIDISVDRDISVVTGVFRKFTDEDLRGNKVYFEDLDKYADNEYDFTTCMLDLELRKLFYEG